MGRASKVKKAKKEAVATNERVIRKFFEDTDPKERGLLAGCWAFGEEPEWMKPGEKEVSEDLAIDIGKHQLKFTPSETVKCMVGFEKAGVFTSYRVTHDDRGRPLAGPSFRVFRFTQRGAYFGAMMQRAAEDGEMKRIQAENRDYAEQAHKLVEASKENPDAAAELTERLILMENQLAELVIPKPGDLAFAIALDEEAKAKKYDESADLVRKARDVLALVDKRRAEAELRARKEAENGGGR